MNARQPAGQARTRIIEVSVIIPVHGRGAMLDQAVRSALAQVEGLGEVVVVDDASPVPVDAATWGDPRVRVLRHEANRGAAAARNSGVAAARCGWIAFLDSDDAWHPEKLARQLAAAAALPDPSRTVLVTGWLGIGGGAETLRAPAPARTLDDFARGCWFSPGSTALMSRAAWDLVGPFDEALPRLEDFDWFLRLGLAGGRVETEPQALAVIRRHRSTASARVLAAARRLEARYCDPEAAGLSLRQRRTVRAYLALERAAARHYAGGAGWLADLARSWRWRPRLRLQVAPPAGAAPADAALRALARGMAEVT